MRSLAFENFSKCSLHILDVLPLLINTSFPPVYITMSFSDFSKTETLKSLNEFLADKSYIEGYVLNR
jgi:hypothetical protein